jgi:TIR domain
MPYDIFISYAKEDESKAKSYATRLEHAGLKVFFAPQVLRETEDNLQARLLSEIDGSQFVLLIWSRWLENSQWVALEMSIYATKRLTVGSNGIRLVAIDFGGYRLPGWLPCDRVLSPDTDSSLEELFQSPDWKSDRNRDTANRHALLDSVRRFASLTRALLLETSSWVFTWREAIPRLNGNFSLSQIRSEELQTPQVRTLILDLALGTLTVCVLTTLLAWILSAWVFSPSYVADWRGYIKKEVLLIGMFVVAAGLVAMLRIGLAAGLAGSLVAVILGSATTLVLGWIRAIERPDPIASGATVGITLGTYAAISYLFGRRSTGPPPRRNWSWRLVLAVSVTLLVIGGVQVLATRLGNLYHLSNRAGRALLGLAFGAIIFLPLAILAAVVAYVQRRGYLWRGAARFGYLLWAALSVATAMFAAFVPESPFDLLNAVGVGLISGAATAGMATFLSAVTESIVGETWGMSAAVIILLVIGLPFLRLAPNIRPVLVYESVIVSTPVAYLLVLAMHSLRKTNGGMTAQAKIH